LSATENSVQPRKAFFISEDPSGQVKRIADGEEIDDTGLQHLATKATGRITKKSGTGTFTKFPLKISTVPWELLHLHSL